jgi:uncharacterized membrane protein
MSLSLHDVPFTTGVCWQPSVALQVSMVHGFTSSQSSGVPLVQTPAWQVSMPLQTSPSVHDVPFVTGVFWQPIIGSQVSAVQTFPSSQASGVPAVQTPAWQLSTPLQTSPSEHVVPSRTGVC